MLFDKLFKNEKGELINILDIITDSGNGRNYIYAMAEAHAIDLIAKTVAKTEIKVYQKNKKTKKIENAKDEIYWMLNMQPNYIENGTSFMYKLALKLLNERKALVLINKNKKRKLLYVADSFDVSKEIMQEKKFSNIHIKDDEGNDINLKSTYTQDDSIYLSIKNDKLSKVKTNFQKCSSELVKVIERKYKRANTFKWRLKKPGQQFAITDVETGKELNYEEYKKKITDGLLSDEEAILMLSEAFELALLNKDISQNLSDYKDIFKMICDNVANLYDIPLDVFYGNKTEKSKSNDDFISFAVDFYYKTIEDGLNIGLVGMESYMEGESIKFNRLSLFHKDILDGATGIEKLISNSFSRNEVNEFIDLPYIDEDWANEHNLTKNYANVKGGEEGNG